MFKGNIFVMGNTWYRKGDSQKRTCFSADSTMKYVVDYMLVCFEGGSWVMSVFRVGGWVMIVVFKEG